jgi:hypothetical protein
VAAELTNLHKKVMDIALRGEVLRIAVTSTFAVHKPRIFEKGMSQKQGKIGKYGTNPISISKSRQAKQTGKTYFKGGYAEYKSAIGKNPGFVNLTNTGQMMADYGVIQKGKDLAYGFQNRENFEKVGWMEDKYDKDIFKVNDDELKIFNRVMDAEIKKRL